MDKSELKRKLTNENSFVEKMAAEYVKKKELVAVAHYIGVSPAILDEIFIENPNLEKKFDESVYDYSFKIGYRKIRAGLPEAISRLNALITDDEGDEATCFRSASKILDVWAKIDAEKYNPKGGKDELDEIFDEIENERNSKENPQNLYTSK